MEERLKHLEAENERLEKEIEHYIKANKTDIKDLRIDNLTYQNNNLRAERQKMKYLAKDIARIKEIVERLESYFLTEDLC